MTGTSGDQSSGGKPAHGAGGAGPSGGEFAGLGLQFAIALIGGLYAGQWMDRRLGTAPWFLMIGVFLGAGLSFYSMYRKLMAAQARDDATLRSHGDTHP